MCPTIHLELAYETGETVSIYLLLSVLNSCFLDTTSAFFKSVGLTLVPHLLSLASKKY